MRAPTKEEYEREFDINMKAYITEKIRLNEYLTNLDPKYKKRYAKFIKETKKQYGSKLKEE